MPRRAPRRPQVRQLRVLNHPEEPSDYGDVLFRTPPRPLVLQKREAERPGPPPGTTLRAFSRPLRPPPRVHVADLRSSSVSPSTSRSVANPRAVWLFTVPSEHLSASAVAATSMPSRNRSTSTA